MAQSSGMPKAAVIGGAATVVIVLVAVVLWLFSAGPLSAKGSDERAAANTVTGLPEASTFDEFNALLCEGQRIPQRLVEDIEEFYAASGSDKDQVFREVMPEQFPDELEVEEVEVAGDNATVTTSSGSSDDTETVDLVREGGSWRVCMPGVGISEDELAELEGAAQGGPAGDAQGGGN